MSTVIEINMPLSPPREAMIDELNKKKADLEETINKRKTRAVQTSRICCPCTYILRNACCPCIFTYCICKNICNSSPLVERAKKKILPKIVRKYLQDKKFKEEQNPGPQGCCDIAITVTDPWTGICPGESQLTDFSFPHEREQLKKIKNEINNRLDQAEDFEKKLRQKQSTDTLDENSDEESQHKKFKIKYSDLLDNKHIPQHIIKSDGGGV